METDQSDRGLFRVKGDSERVVVRDDLKAQIESEGMTGCLFQPVDVST